MNTGKQFEILTQHLFSELISQQLVSNVEVQHNVVIQGKLLSHQIDVYWEFEVADIKYRTVVQAKDWMSPVPQGELLKFKSVLDDLPGQPRGIL